jgi:hypothetical protein
MWHSAQRTQKTHCTHYANGDERRNNISSAKDLYTNYDSWYAVWERLEKLDHGDR